MAARTPIGPPRLTDRQREVARLIRDDLTNGEIGERLGVSLDTAKGHVSELMGRLDLKRREQIGDWYHANYGGIRRFRALWGAPLAWVVGGMAATGATTAAVVVVLVVLGSLGAGQAGEQSGGRIAVAARGPAGGDSEIYLVNADGTGYTNLSDNPGVDAYPRWSPDGTKLVFESLRKGNFHLQIYLVKADGTGLTALTDDRETDAFQAAWSPDGSRIVFVRARQAYRRDPQEIWLMNADGSGEMRLSGGNSRGPVWSPDGTNIAFSLFHDSAAGWQQGVATYVVNADDAGITQLTDHGSPLSWSPDGAQIAIESGRDAIVGGPHDIGTDIWVVNADGSGQRRLTNQPGRDYSAVWSPDGGRVLFVSDRDGNENIYVINADGSGLTRLTDEPAIDGAAMWSNDGTRILFISGRDGEMALYTMHADGSDQAPLVIDTGAPVPIWFLGLAWAPEP